MAGPTHKCAPNFCSRARPSTCALQEVMRYAINMNKTRTSWYDNMWPQLWVPQILPSFWRLKVFFSCALRFHTRAYKQKKRSHNKITARTLRHIQLMMYLECQKVDLPSGWSNLHSSNLQLSAKSTGGDSRISSSVSTRRLTCTPP